MDIPDDLSGMAPPVPHYRDITPTPPRTLPSPIGGILVTLTLMGAATWLTWGIHIVAGWLG